MVSRRHFDGSQYRWHDIDGTHLSLDNLPSRYARTRDNQRNMHGRVVKKNSVGRFAVLAQALTMVRHDHKESPI